MAVTIVNPARFNDDGLGTRRFIRAAFFDEGYGSSTSFKAYAQGAGIVPATSAFDAIGAGTVGDPLRMSQFNGFVVPSFVTFSPVGSLTFIDRPILENIGYEAQAEITITASSSVVWNWTQEGGTGAFPAGVTVANGGSNSIIRFYFPWNGSSPRQVAWEVNAGGYYWRVELLHETFD